MDENSPAAQDDQLPAIPNRPSIDTVFKKHKLSIDDFALCLKRGINAKKVIKNSYGDIIDEIDDLTTQHKFLDSGLLLLGYMKQNNVNVQVVNLSAAEKELLEAYKRK